MPLKRKISPAQVDYIKDLFAKLGFRSSDRKGLLERDFGVRFEDELDMEQASTLIDYLLEQ